MFFFLINPLLEIFYKIAFKRNNKYLDQSLQCFAVISRAFGISFLVILLLGTWFFHLAMAHWRDDRLWQKK